MVHPGAHGTIQAELSRTPATEACREPGDDVGTRFRNEVEERSEIESLSPHELHEIAQDVSHTPPGVRREWRAPTEERVPALVVVGEAWRVQRHERRVK